MAHPHALEGRWRQVQDEPLSLVRLDRDLVDRSINRHRGIAASMSYEAKARGVTRGMRLDTVEFENARVRVLRITYGSREKSVMHGHPASVAVFLTDGQAKCTLPNGKTEKRSWKAGQTMWLAADKHLTENMSDKPFELILVELKAKPTKTTSAKTT